MVLSQSLFKTIHHLHPDASACQSIRFVVPMTMIFFVACFVFLPLMIFHYYIVSAKTLFGSALLPLPYSS